MTTTRPALGERAARHRRGQGDREERSAAEASADSSPYQLPIAIGAGTEGIGQRQDHHGHDEDVAPIETNYRRGQHWSGAAGQNSAVLRPKARPSNARRSTAGMVTSFQVLVEHPHDVVDEGVERRTQPHPLEARLRAARSRLTVLPLMWSFSVVAVFGVVLSSVTAGSLDGPD